MQLLLYKAHADTTFNNKYSQATQCREIYITGTRRKKREGLFLQVRRAPRSTSALSVVCHANLIELQTSEVNNTCTWCDSLKCCLPPRLSTAVQHSYLITTKCKMFNHYIHSLFFSYMFRCHIRYQQG